MSCISIKLQVWHLVVESCRKHGRWYVCIEVESQPVSSSCLVTYLFFDQTVLKVYHYKKGDVRTAAWQGARQPACCHGTFCACLPAMTTHSMQSLSASCSLFSCYGYLVGTMRIWYRHVWKRLLIACQVHPLSRDAVKVPSVQCHSD